MKRLLVVFLSFGLFMQPVFVVAQQGHEEGELKEEVDELNGQVKERESKIRELNQMIQTYKTRIAEQERARASLQNQVALLENRIEEKQLAVARTKEEINVTNLQIDRLQRQIELQQRVVDRREATLADLVREIHETDGVKLMDVFLTRPSLSEFFTRVESLKSVEREMVEATQEMKESKRKLEAEKIEADTRRVDLQKRRVQLEREERELESDRGAKVSLVALTASQEEEFQRIVYELRQQQQEEASEMADLRERLKEKLDSIDEALARGDILLNWPLPVARGISAHFHDPTYPYRKLFEHPGVDVPAPVGTPVRAAAGGYVAWNKMGKQYGNYVMIIHPGGIATVYAHLSRFALKPDTYVERGDIIGYSGGRPGDQGAGLSTGPHLHFEVRQNGIPVNPEAFLPSLD